MPFSITPSRIIDLFSSSFAQRFLSSNFAQRFLSSNFAQRFLSSNFAQRFSTQKRPAQKLTQKMALSNSNVKLRMRLKEDTGSISVLIMGLFIILLTSSISILDISDSYIAKRELTNLGESAITLAAQSLDQASYYQNGIAGAGELVPIDCNLASTKFADEIEQSKLRGNVISVDSFQCDKGQVIADISSINSPPIRFPLINQIIGSNEVIKASVGAGSIVQNSNS